MIKGRKQRILNKQVSSKNGKWDFLKDNHPWGLFELHCLKGLPFRFIIMEMQNLHKIQTVKQKQNALMTR